MPTCKATVLIIMLLWCQSFLNVSAQNHELIYLKAGKINVLSKAPLETIKAGSYQLRGILNTTNQKFAFSLSNRSITGFNSALQQQHFYENYIETDKFSTSTFTGKIIEPVNFSVDGVLRVRAKGNLNIHGVSVEKIIPVNLIIQNDSVQFNAKFSIRLDDYNINIPKIVAQKIAEEVSIEVEGEFTLNK